MKNLFNPTDANEIKTRLANLRPDSARQWGTMTPSQAIAHCSAGVQMALGEIRPPRAFIGLLFGPTIKRLALRDDEPMRRNSPTMRELISPNQPDFETEREKLSQLIDRFATTGPASCTTHPHAFFGKLTPNEWAILMYKHLDHHLRQFAA